MHKSVNSKILHSTLSLGFLNFVSVLITCVCIEDGTLKMIVTCNVVTMVCVVGIGCDIQPSTLTLTHNLKNFVNAKFIFPKLKFHETNCIIV